MIESILRYVSSVAVAVLVIVLLFVLQQILARSAGAEGHQARNQLILFGLTAAGLLLVILVMPIGDSTRGQILGLIGIVLSAGIALASTTFLGNAMAGIMLRAVKNFRLGDFIRAGEHFGRVSERGIFHTEIQTEDRDLTTLPNLYLVTHPVTTVRSSGTIVSATVSLGYDVPRTRIGELLLAAGHRAGLRDPFVQILDLGDFSVTYRIAGLLEEVKQIITARSRLRGCVMDALHEGGVEIVSPTFMNTRAQEAGRKMIPSGDASVGGIDDGAPEAVLFDKADEAESLAALKEQRRTVAEDSAAREKTDPEIEVLQQRLERLDRVIAEREARVDD